VKSNVPAAPVARQQTEASNIDDHLSVQAIIRSYQVCGEKIAF